MSRYIFVLIFFALNFFIHNISIANYDLSLKAYNNKKWELAFSECKNMINDDKCLNLLGILYLNGLGISKDISKSYNLFSQAEKLGNKSAIFNLGWMALMGLGEEVNIDKASAYFKESIKNLNNDNKPIVDEDLIKESKENLIKLSKNNIIAKFNVFYADYLKLINLVKYKINIEKQYITDITSIDKKLIVFENKLINLEINIDDLKEHVNKEQNILIKLLILNLSNDYLEFEKVINKTYIDLNRINLE